MSATHSAIFEFLRFCNSKVVIGIKSNVTDWNSEYAGCKFVDIWTPE